MKLIVKVKQDKVIESIEMVDIKHHYFDKNYLVITGENTNRRMFKTSTVLELKEEK